MDDDGDGRRRRCTPRRGPSTREPDDAWLTAVAEAASRDAGGVPVELLGEYLPLLADAAAHGRRPGRSELEAVGLLGRRAAELGVSAGHAVDLYLSAAWRLWRQLPVVVRSRDSEVVRGAAEAVLHVVDDAVATLAEGYAATRREMVRREETLRWELIDDLVRGDADVGGLVERAEPFGLDIDRTHQGGAGGPEPTTARRRGRNQCPGARRPRPARRPRRAGRDQGGPARRAGPGRGRAARDDFTPWQGEGKPRRPHADADRDAPHKFYGDDR
jgi:hypothetical protein